MSSRFHAVECPWEVDPNLGVLQSTVETRDSDTLEIDCIIAVRYLRDERRVPARIRLRATSVVFFQRRLWFSDRLALDPEMGELEEFSWNRKLMDEYHATGSGDMVFKEKMEEWGRTGLCPDPNFYTVEPSWLPPSFIYLPEHTKHHLMVDDTFVTEFVTYDDVHWEEHDFVDS